MQARTVAQVVAAEAGGKTHKDRLSAMRDVFSAMVNRAQLTGQTLESVISGRKQFDAYSKKMPAGTPNLVGLAQEAIDDVMANGTTLPPDVTYYAREYATKNLPKGLKAYKTAVDKHVYFSDPKNRAIVTAAGAKKPSMARMKDTLAKTVNVVPEQRPTDVAAAPAQGPLSAFLEPAAPPQVSPAQAALARAMSAQPAPAGPSMISAPDFSAAHVPGMSIPADVASPHTMADLGGIGAALSRQQTPASDFAARPEQIAPNSQPLPDIPGLYSRNLEQRLSAVAGPGFGAQSLEHQLAKALGMVEPDAQPSGFMARPEHVASNTMRPSVDVANTPDEVDRLSQAQMPSTSSFLGRPAGPLGQTPSKKEGRVGKGAFAATAPSADRFNPAPSEAQFDARFGAPAAPPTQDRVASFTPTGPMTNDVYSPSGGFASVDPHAFSSVVDPMDSNFATEAQASADRNLPAHPEPSTYATYQDRVAGWQADKAARKAAATQMAATVASAAAPQVAAAATPSPSAVAPAQPAPADVASNMPALGPPKDVKDYNVAAAAPSYTPPDLGLEDGRHIPGFNLQNALAQIAEDPNLQKQAVAENVIAPLDQATVAPPVDVAPPAVRQRAPAPATQTAYAEPSRQAPSMPSIDREIGGVKASDAFSVGTGLQGITAAKSGPRGAFATSLSNPDMGVMSLGPNLGDATYNSKYDTTTFRDPSGKTTGVQYGKPGGFFGALGRALGLGDDHDKGGGKSSGKSGKSGGGKGAFGGSTHSSNSVT